LRLDFQRYRAENVFRSLISGDTAENVFESLIPARLDRQSCQVMAKSSHCLWQGELKTPQPTKGQRYNRITEENISNIVEGKNSLG
jgi:hypothetical protein